MDPSSWHPRSQMPDGSVKCKSGSHRIPYPIPEESIPRNCLIYSWVLPSRHVILLSGVWITSSSNHRLTGAVSLSHLQNNCWLSSVKQADMMLQRISRSSRRSVATNSASCLRNPVSNLPSILPTTSASYYIGADMCSKLRSIGFRNFVTSRSLFAAVSQDERAILREWRRITLTVPVHVASLSSIGNFWNSIE